MNATLESNSLRVNDPQKDQILLRVMLLVKVYDLLESLVPVGGLIVGVEGAIDEAVDEGGLADKGRADDGDLESGDGVHN